MKKTIVTAVSKVMLMVMALLAQFTAFAADGNQGDETRWQVVSRMPQFWAGVVLFIVFLSLGLMSGRRKQNELA